MSVVSGMGITFCTVWLTSDSRAMIGERIRGDRHGQRLAGRDVNLDVGDDILHAEFGVSFADVSARKAARIIRFILNPEPHIAFRSLLDGELHLIHMLLRKILAFPGYPASRREVDDED